LGVNFKFMLKQILSFCYSINAKITLCGIGNNRCIVIKINVGSILNLRSKRQIWIRFNTVLKITQATVLVSGEILTLGFLYANKFLKEAKIISGAGKKAE
jgi:hypothetical protein